MYASSNVYCSSKSRRKPSLRQSRVRRLRVIVIADITSLAVRVRTSVVRVHVFPIRHVRVVTGIVAFGGLVHRCDLYGSTREKSACGIRAAAAAVVVVGPLAATSESIIIPVRV